MGLFGKNEEWKDIIESPFLTIEGTKFETYLKELIQDEIREMRIELHELAKEMGYTKGHWKKKK